MKEKVKNVKIIIYQENFFLKEIPKAPAGQVKINVTFKINENAILTKFGKKTKLEL